MECQDNVGLSDIIDVLNTLDTRAAAEQSTATTALAQQQQQNILTQESASECTRVKAPQRERTASTSSSSTSSKRHKPYIRILEQPAGKAVRFRYKCEGRSAGSIPGANSTPENKTYPSIEIVGYKGEVVIVVSCVTKDAPYRPHPHNLVGKDGCKNGICTLVLNKEPLRAVFSNLGIQCVKKNDIKAALEERAEIKVDPFKTKFGHKDQPSSIDLNAVRLCFQAFLKTPDGVKALTPVVTEPIYDKKAISELVICRLCSCSAKVSGGDEIILLCEKVAKDDIKVRFYEQNADGSTRWEDFAEFQQNDIHKQTAIAFKTPRYHTSEITEKAQVLLQLVRPSDGATSESLPFDYYPETDNLKRKRIKSASSPMNILRRELQKHERLQNVNLQNDFQDTPTNGANFWNSSLMPAIKTEPATSPQHFGPHRSPYQLGSPSPQPPSPINHRLDTPSPGLMKALSAGSQTQMCDMFAYNAALHEQQQQQEPSAFQAETPLPQKQQTVSTNPFIACTSSTGIDNSTSNGDCDFNKLLPSPFPTQQETAAYAINLLLDHQTTAPSTSGGSITPMWMEQERLTLNNPFAVQTMDFVGTQVLPTQPQQQLQNFQQQEQIQHDIEMLVNATEECPTLSGLLAYVEGEQLLNINSEDLPLSNLSIST